MCCSRLPHARRNEHFPEDWESGSLENLAVADTSTATFVVPEDRHLRYYRRWDRRIDLVLAVLLLAVVVLAPVEREVSAFGWLLFFSASGAAD